jgi:hypothetical protein
MRLAKSGDEIHHDVRVESKHNDGHMRERATNGKMKKKAKQPTKGDIDYAPITDSKNNLICMMHSKKVRGCISSRKWS